MTKEFREFGLTWLQSTFFPFFGALKKIRDARRRPNGVEDEREVEGKERNGGKGPQTKFAQGGDAPVRARPVCQKPD
ncbi:unnamed protein product [marine sediment metagenome]|uniref:Uncharacterized protein n=1 Tax=marine sediment metagenome TaxID=412755 RepID=X0U1J7_9ZZZZ